ncbi:penicillin-binding protein 2 [Paludibacter sp. 221]|uniref:penicillin-binding protein 2 n=1 Tax=Paludibacter sp. 221 TaxID=2302939 RepID=UPI0013D566B6|nr:penicillin-binding protein 2 [Paludibacter sp. 221]NDV47190.1 penicillin-binding protein 2 [Paludibacter sp. 221]
MINDPYQNRKYVIAAIIVGVILIYIIRLFSLQILETKYKEGAESNALLYKTVYASRGLIYDRDGKLLVYNKPAYDITVIMREVQNLDTLDFCRTLGISKEYFDTRIAEIKDTRRNRSYSSYTPQFFMTQLEMKDVAAFQQSNYKYPGFYIQNRTLREYTYQNAAHVLGSIGEVSRQQVEADSYYKQGDYAGRDGIEYAYEKELRGEKGVEILLRDSKGRIMGKYENGEFDESPVAGSDIKLTIDIELQRLGELLLSGKTGSIVAIEPASGEILAMVSHPTFDPSLLVGRERSKNYSELVSDKTQPLLNRATQGQYSPGSTFKILQALISLDMGGVSERTTFSCQGPDSRPIKCTHRHKSPVNIYDAIEQSCNPYFWNAFKNTLEIDGYGDRNEDFKKTYQIWEDKVKSFGLGSRIAGTDVYEQLGGDVPSGSYYTRYYGETGWRALTIRSLSIGQGELLVTPLQLANMTAAVANDGYYITPHLRKTDSLALKVNKVHIDNNKHFATVKEGMKRMVENTWNGKLYKVPGVDMGGKTGTVQNPHGEDHSLYVAFAPLHNPTIAIAAVIENAGFGASWAMPIANLMIEQYLFGEVKRKALLEEFINKTTNPDVKRY